jgi:hypothetical protein
MNTIRKFKWFWAWQDEKEETWLSEMAKEGLHLVSVSVPGYYYFRQGEPENFVYRLDFQTMKSTDRDSYLQLFADAGWEHIGDMGGWVYFRHRVNGGEILDIYSDLESKMRKYFRIMFYLVIFFPIMIVFVLKTSGLERYGPWFIIVKALSVFLLLVFSFAIVQLFRRMLTLKKRDESTN